jgi:hypothetical protein
MPEDLIDGFDRKKIYMTEEYTTEGDIVSIDGEKRNAPARLNINPKDIVITAYNLDPPSFSPKELIVRQLNCQLIFYDLKLVLDTSIARNNELRETTYTSPLMLATTGNDIPKKYQGFTFEFEGIDDWIGNTKLRGEMISSFYSRGNPSRFSERLGNINNDEKLFIFYNYVKGFDLNWCGIKFNPSIDYTGLNHDLDNIIDCIDKFQKLVSFLCGKIIFPKRVSLIPFTFDRIEFYAIDSNRASAKQNDGVPVLFPMNEDIRYPDCVWAKYFNLPDNLAYGFDLFYNYSLLSNNPDKFLGMFRVLELFANKYQKVVIEKNNLSAILNEINQVLCSRNEFNSEQIQFIADSVKRANSSTTIKYRLNELAKDTEAGLIDSFHIDSAFINRITNTRHSITHARPIELTRDELYIDIKRMEIWIYSFFMSYFGFDPNETYRCLWKRPGSQSVHLVGNIKK